MRTSMDRANFPPAAQVLCRLYLQRLTFEQSAGAIGREGRLGEGSETGGTVGVFVSKRGQGCL